MTTSNRFCSGCGAPDWWSPCAARVAGPPQAVSVKDVIEASEHVTFEVNCDLHRVDDERCDPATACSIRPVWRLLERRINEVLAGVSLADLQHAEPEVYQIAGAATGN